MAKKRKGISDLLAGGVLERVMALKDPDLIILRGHGLVEASLFSLLAIRLDVEAAELPSLNFDLLARVSLAGEAYSHILDSVLKLNKMRNVVAHHVESDDINSLMRDFVSTMPDRLAREAHTHKSDISLHDLFRASIMVILYALLQLTSEHGRLT